MKALLLTLAAAGTFGLARSWFCGPCTGPRAAATAAAEESDPSGLAPCCAAPEAPESSVLVSLAPRSPAPEATAIEAPATAAIEAPATAAIEAPATAAIDAPATAGRWVEARTASVFAGACHYNGELTTQGRRAVVAGVFSAGTLDGVELDGLAFAAVAVSPENLAEGAERRSVLFVPAALPASERAALERAVRAEHGAALGRVERVVPAALEVAFEGEDYAVRVATEAGRVVELTGAARADRACCKMPLNVWYDPLTAIDEPVVGLTALLRVADLGLGPAFERFDENDAFVGRWGRE